MYWKHPLSSVVLREIRKLANRRSSWLSQRVSSGAFGRRKYAATATTTAVSHGQRDLNLMVVCWKPTAN
jgi:hypothetical protein